jgi:hypothetical protein
MFAGKTRAYRRVSVAPLWRRMLICRCSKVGEAFKPSRPNSLPARNDSGRVTVNDESGEGFAGRALRVGIGPGKDEVKAGHAAVGDPGNQLQLS